MKYAGKIKPLYSGLNAAPFIGVLFVMLPMLLFHTSIVFKPGVEVNISLPVSDQKSGVTDPSLSVAVDSKNILYFQNQQVLGQVYSLTVEEKEEGMPLVDLVINRAADLDLNLVNRSVEKRRILLNGKLAQPEALLKRGQQIELDVPSTELLRRRIERAIEQEVFALEMGYGLLVLADKKKGGDLLDRITGARTNFAKEMGMLQKGWPVQICRA